MIIPKVPDAIVLYFVLCVYSVMSLEETINKLIKAVENSSRADMQPSKMGMPDSTDTTPSNQTTPNIPWDGNIPTDCKCVLWIDGMNDTKTPGKDVDCVRLKCGTTYYGRVFTQNAPNGIGYWQRSSRQS